MSRLNPATTSMSHQNGMLPVFVGGSGVVEDWPLYWPCQEMMPMPIR